jgi:restriction endonuclease S subunit
MRKTFILLFLFILLLSCSAAFAVEIAPRISDKEIIEKLSALDAKIDKVDAKIDIEIANVRGDIKELKAGQIALQQQIADLKDFMFWGFGILFAGMFTLVGFVLWDRRTALSPAIRKNKELEEREEKIEKVLKEYAYKEPRLAQILRSVGIM